MQETICNNLRQIRRRIQQVAERCGRDPASIQLVAVSKRQPVEAIQAALACDQLLFGENYVQEAVEKRQQMGSSIRLHCIGHLQSNKIKQAVCCFDVIETVDRLKTALAIDRFCDAQGCWPEILVQVNIGRDPGKSGVLPEASAALLEQIRAETSLVPRGLMTIAPWTADPEGARVFFQKLKKLSLALAEKDLFADTENIQLSMGMSRDYHIAIEEGATLVRVGTAIFGPRPK